MKAHNMIRRKLSKQVVDSKEYEIWNAFVDLIAMEPEGNLTETQKVAQRAFWYDSELQNGGHLQYFENHRKDDYSDVIRSLKLIGAGKQAAVLEKASALFLAKNRKPIWSVFEFVKKAKEGGYNKLDSDYYSIQPDMNHFLGKYLKSHINDFIEIIF